MLSILKWNERINTLKGRLFIGLLALAVFNLSSCVTYQATKTDINEISEEEQVTNNLEHYSFYVHDAYGTYLLEGAEFNKDKTLSGTLKPVNVEAFDSTWNKKERKAYYERHLYEINIYCNRNFDNLTADQTNTTNVPTSDGITITNEDVDKMTITTQEGLIHLEGTAAIILVASIFAIMIAIIIWLLIDNDVNSDSNGSGSDSWS